MRRFLLAFFLLVLGAAPVLFVLGAVPAHAVTVHRVVSPGGIEAWLVEDHSNPIISVALSFRGGAALDPVGKEGLATLVSGLLDEGAGEMESLAFQTKLEDLSIHMTFDASRDAFGGSLKTLTENRDTAFDLLRLALSKPRFDPDPVERIRSQIIAMLKRDAEDPQSVASKTWFHAAFPHHPYGRPDDGTIASVGTITPADLKAFAGRRFSRNNLIIGVAGDITAEALKPLLDSTFGVLPAKAAPAPVENATPTLTGSTVVVDKDIPQSVAMFGHAGLKRADPDFYAAYLLNYIMGGGGFASRLMAEVREKRGLAYSVYSYLMPFDHAAVFIGGVATRNDRFALSLKLVREEWRRMAETGPTEQELKNAKTYLTGSWPLQLDGTGPIAGILVAIQRDNLGIDYLDKRNGYIEAVSMDHVRTVAARLLDPARLTIVVVGKPAGMTATQ